MIAPIDEARPTREGEELDLGKLNALLDERLPGYDGGRRSTRSTRSPPSIHDTR